MFLGLEFGLLFAPSVLFFVAYVVRATWIRDIGEGRPVFSCLFMQKVVLCIVMAILKFFQIILVLASKQSATWSNWINQCGDDWLIIIYAVESLAWLLSTNLMIVEYKRRLSEAWYANQFFWVANLSLSILNLIILYKDFSTLTILFTSFNIFANLVLVILMARTKKRTLQNRRPDPSGAGQGDLRGVLLGSTE